MATEEARLAPGGDGTPAATPTPTQPGAPVTPPPPTEPVTEEPGSDEEFATVKQLEQMRRTMQAAQPAGTWLSRQASLATLGVLLVILSPVFAYLAYHLVGGDNIARQALFGWAFGSLIPIAGIAVWGLGSDRRDPLAFLVDGDRNRYSLSKLQIGVWTALIGGAIVAAVIANLDTGAAATDASSFTIPEEVWALLGISTIGFVGSSLVKSQKRAAPTLPQGATAATAVPNTAGRGFTTLGSQACADAPHIADLVQAEGSSGPTAIDMGKVQMLIFTVVVMFAYVMVLAEAFQSTLGAETPVALTAFPAIDRSLATLIAISHAGYLVNKSVSTTPAVKTAPAPDGA